MQSFKKIYSVVMKLNQFFALQFLANSLYLDYSNNGILWLFSALMHPKDAYGMANSVDANQTAPSGAV